MCQTLRFHTRNDLDWLQETSLQSSAAVTEGKEVLPEAPGSVAVSIEAYVCLAKHVTVTATKQADDAPAHIVPTVGAHFLGLGIFPGPASDWLLFPDLSALADSLVYLFSRDNLFKCMGSMHGARLCATVFRTCAFRIHS